QAASLPWEWTPALKAHADEMGITFFSAPYDLEAVEMLDPYVPAYKIGSGDITWHEILKKIAEKKKPVILATGASTLKDVDRAVALGARIIEKHFTDDRRRDGPDHPFSMTPATWETMVHRTRELERALGSTEKVVCGNEEDTVVVQRRCLRAARNLKVGTLLKRDDFSVLRPAPPDGIFPYDLEKVVGRRLQVDL